MAKQTFSRISAKAATITGAIIGLLCWAGGVAVYGLTGYGASFFHGYNPLSLVAGVVLGAIGGAALAVIYNWALRIS